MNITNKTQLTNLLYTYRSYRVLYDITHDIRWKRKMNIIEKKYLRPLKIFLDNKRES